MWLGSPDTAVRYCRAFRVPPRPSPRRSLLSAAPNLIQFCQQPKQQQHAIISYPRFYSFIQGAGCDVSPSGVRLSGNTAGNPIP